MKRYAIQLKLDVFYNDDLEIGALYKALLAINDNGEFKVEIPSQPCGGEDVTDFYKSQGKVTGELTKEEIIKELVNNPDYKENLSEILSVFLDDKPRLEEWKKWMEDKKC